MRETFVQICWIQEFKIIFFSKNVGKEHFESDHLSKYTFNNISQAVSSSSTYFLSGILAKSWHFLTIFLGDHFVVASSRGFFFRADAHSHCCSQNVSHLNGNLFIFLNYVQVYFWLDGWVSRRWLQIIFYSKKLEIIFN